MRSKTRKLERVIKSSKTRMLRALFAKPILNFTLIAMRSPENLERVKWHDLGFRNITLEHLCIQELFIKHLLHVEIDQIMHNRGVNKLNEIFALVEVELGMKWEVMQLEDKLNCPRDKF